jgi:hypothetical protein
MVKTGVLIFDFPQELIHEATQKNHEEKNQSLVVLCGFVDEIFILSRARTGAWVDTDVA